MRTYIIYFCFPEFELNIMVHARDHPGAKLKAVSQLVSTGRFSEGELMKYIAD